MDLKQKNPQTFNDGLAQFWRIGNAAEPGRMPKEKRIPFQTLRYGRRIVGINRYWTAMEASTKISQVIRCPRVREIHEQDNVTLEDGQDYQIKQIQYPEDIFPLVMDISLERLEWENGADRTD